MKWIYRFVLSLAKILLPIVGLLVPKVKYFLAGRKNLFESLSGFRKENPWDLIWFHVASLGEYEQARPVIALLKGEHPETKIMVSFFSPSGYDNVVKKPQLNVDFISYIPLDTKKNATHFVSLLNPTMAFFVKYDLWYEHILALKNRHIPIYLFSASFRPDQSYFKSDGFFRKILFQLDHIFTQNHSTLELLKNIDYQEVSFAGDTRFDRVADTAKNPKVFPELGEWASGEIVNVAGSVWQEDMDLLIPLLNKNPHEKWIIAPHDLGAEPMKRWASQLKSKSLRYSQWDKKSDASIIFIDNIGMLSSLYQFARIAYVGGAFGKGLHNILEPLGFGVPVIFGKLKKQAKFPEANESQLNRCGFEVCSVQEIEAVYFKLQQEEFYKESVLASQKWVNSNVGAAQRVVDGVEKMFVKS